MEFLCRYWHLDERAQPRGRKDAPERAVAVHRDAEALERAHEDLGIVVQGGAVDLGGLAEGGGERERPEGLALRGGHEGKRGIFGGAEAVAAEPDLVLEAGLAQAPCGPAESPSVLYSVHR